MHITPQLLNRVLHPLNYHKPGTWPPMVVFQGGFGDVAGEVDQTWCRGPDLMPWAGWGGKGMHLWLAGMWDHSVSDGTSLRKGTRALSAPSARSHPFSLSPPPLSDEADGELMIGTRPCWFSCWKRTGEWLLLLLCSILPVLFRMNRLGHGLCQCGFWWGFDLPRIRPSICGQSCP